MVKEPLILLLETSGNTCSVALSKGTDILAEAVVSEVNAHSRLLIPLSKKLLESEGFQFSDLHALALSEGPGSYTGLRIGASFAKAVCYAHRIPLIAINTLEGWARAGKREVSNRNYYAGTVDARRMDLYLAIFGPDMSAELAPAFYTIDEALIQVLSEFPGLHLCGSGAAKLAEELKLQDFTWSEFLELRASDLITPAFKKFMSGDFSDYVYFEPNYIKSVHITTAKK